MPNIAVWLCGALFSAAALAADVGVVGLLPGKAILVIDGERKTLSVGSSHAGVKLLAIEGNGARVEVAGKQRRLTIGQHVYASAGGSSGSATLTADARGHFLTEGSINGASVRFLVDTGATLIGLGRGDAMKVGIDWQRGQPGVAMTANGATRVWKVTLDQVRIGSITLHNVDALVHEHDLPIALLGMSFLSRMEMQHQGSTLQLRQRY